MIEYVFTYVADRIGPPLGIMIAFFVSCAIVVLPFAILDDRGHSVLAWFWLIGSSLVITLTWMGVLEYYGVTA